MMNLKHWFQQRIDVFVVIVFQLLFVLKINNLVAFCSLFSILQNKCLNLSLIVYKVWQSQRQSSRLMRPKRLSGGGAKV